MMVDNTTKILFYPFFRRVGNPYQKLIHNIREFKQFLMENNGIRDCFIAVYDNYKTIDKLFFDLDILDIKLAYKFYKYLTDQGLSVIPVFSGKKGFHFYVLLKPMRFKSIDDAIATIRQVSYTLIDESGMYIKQKSNDGEEYKVSLLDSRIIGDINRLTRVPNTLRPPENLTYCTYLPPDFSDMSLEDLICYSKSPHYMNNEYNIKRRYKLTDLPTTDAIYDYHQGLYSNTACSSYNSSILFTSNLDKIDKSIKKFLKLLLRPCLYYYITTEEPPHDIRTATVCELRTLEFGIEDIVAIFSRLKWCDWDESKTRYHVIRIVQKGLKRYSCRTLRELGFCFDDCDRRW